MAVIVGHFVIFQHYLGGTLWQRIFQAPYALPERLPAGSLPAVKVRPPFLQQMLRYISVNMLLV
ncbi:MAG: hypothetical protein ACTSYK_06710 [Alphaproteobacteria bacterium]